MEETAERLQESKVMGNYRKMIFSRHDMGVVYMNHNGWKCMCSNRTSLAHPNINLGWGRSSYRKLKSYLQLMAAKGEKASVL